MHSKMFSIKRFRPNSSQLLLGPQLIQMEMLPYTSTRYDAERREWSGAKKKEVYNEAVTLGEVMHEVLTKNPSKVIQIYDVTGETLTCGQLLEFSQVLSKYLVMELGLSTSKDVLGLCAGNTTHVVTIMLASFLCGTPVHALYQGFDKETVNTLYRVTRPKVLFCDVDNYEIIKSVNEELNLGAPIFVLNGHVEGASNIRDLLQTIPLKTCKTFRFPCLDLHGDDTAMIIASSGTTGLPKGVLVSHRALLNQGIFQNIKTDSVVFGFSVMYWISGAFAMVSSLVNGCVRIVTDKPFTPEYFLELVMRHQITHILTSASQLTEVSLSRDLARTRQSLASVDSVMVGGSKVPLVTQKKMLDVLGDNLQRPGVVVAYGMSELGGLLTLSCTRWHCKQALGTEGKLLPNTKVKIVNRTDEPLGPNELGEICISMPYPWSGYYKNEEATRNALRGDWFYSSDIGYFDDEGLLHFDARANDIFKHRNFQIFPQVIEEIVLSLNGVADVCVFGIPDLVATNLIGCAVVRTRDDVGLNLRKQDVTKKVESEIGSMYHLSGGVYFVNAIPKTASGKHQRHSVWQMVMQMNEKS